jgi:arylsulfatase A-like enzyme
LRSNGLGARIAIAAACGASAALAGGCGRAGTSMNVILLVVDTERADHVSCYGYERPTTPNADRLAATGLVFRNANVQASFSQGSYASLFTGLHPQSHGVRNHPGTLAPECVTMAETFASHGYRTAGFHNHPLLQTVYGFGQGMATYEGTPTCTTTITRALDWIDAQGDAPWFLFLQFMEPHAPYQPPPPFDEKFGKRPDGFLDGAGWKPGQGYPQKWMFDFDAQHLRPADVEFLKASYDGEIAYVDSEIGRLLDALEKSGRRERTLLVYTADHGEAFGEHGVWFNHDATLYEEILHVPLIVSNPMLFPARRDVEDVVREIDVLPTLLDVLDWSSPVRIEGESLLPLLGGAQAPRLAIAENRPLETSRVGMPNYRMFVPGNEGKWRSIRRGGTKLLRIPKPGGDEESLFDLATDPREQRDAALDRAAEKRELESELDRFTSRAPRAETRPTALSAEDSERLKALGYTGSPK